MYGTVGQKGDCVGVVAAAAAHQSGSEADPLCGIATSTNVFFVRVLCAWHSYNSAWFER